MNVSKEYRVTIHPAMEVDATASISITYSTNREAEIVRNAMANLLLFLQDDLRAMEDYSNMIFTEERVNGGDWEVVD